MPMYEFSCDEPKGCGKTTDFLCSFDDLPKNPKCEHCGKGGLRRLYSIGMIKTTYSQNGREAVAVSMGDGKKIYRSKTRDNHLAGKGTKSVYTKEYQNHLDKGSAMKAAQIKHEMKKRRER